MKKTSKNKSGFTLVELMVVAVIVAILAAVAIPLMSSNKKRAIATEAQAALGTIRSALRAQYAETGAYDKDINGNDIADGSSVTNIPGITGNDLNGRYFTGGSYALRSVEDETYVLEANGGNQSNPQAPEAGQVADMVITLDQDGSFQFESGL